MAQVQGKIVQCIGAVVDIQFPRDAMPRVYEALKLEPSSEKSFAEEGLTFEGLPAGSNPEAPPGLLYTVTEIYPEHVVLDGNHPLAGIALRLSLKVESVREATDEEVGRGTLGAGFFKVQPQAPGGNLLH